MHFDSRSCSVLSLRYKRHFDHFISIHISSILITFGLFTSIYLSLRPVHIEQNVCFDHFTSTQSFMSIFSLRYKNFTSIHSLRQKPSFFRTCTSILLFHIDFSLRLIMHFDTLPSICIEGNGSKCNLGRSEKFEMRKRLHWSKWIPAGYPSYKIG